MPCSIITKKSENIYQKTQKICSVIKADGYGHGAIPIAKTLSEAGIDAFAVAASQEAVALRKKWHNMPYFGSWLYR